MAQSPSRNPLVSGRSSQERKQSMFDRLTQPAIQNTSPAYHLAAQPTAAAHKQLIVVTLDKLRPYEGNPRRTKNPAFDEIKASIKARGLDHAPNITQRPGDDFYTIADGGNTRLQALKELFQETQDSRFWSIECVFKPWQGDDIDSELNMIIGHLAENDIRGELTFIEKALGIREVKALYEKKYSEFFSHRKLADKLGENGYPISNQLLSRMEQCLTYLYPHIPNILLAGMGKPQIDKLVGMHNKAKTSWDKYQETYAVSVAFDEIWMHTLSPFDEEVANFSLSDLQDTLIGKMVEGLNYQVSYDALKLEIDLEERKLQKLMEKRDEISQRASESEQHLQHQLEQKQTSLPKKSEKSESPIQGDSQPQAREEDELSHTLITSNTFSPAEEADSEESAGFSPILDEVQDETLNQVISTHLAGFGFTSEETRQEEAEENGLAFANTGRQPISHLWKVYPNRKHKMDAYSIALDIAEECGIAHLVHHVVYEPVDYSFTLLPLDIEQPSPLVRCVYDLLYALRTDKLQERVEETMLSVPAELLLGSPAEEPSLSDLLLVRLFRLIRLIRYLKEHYRQGEHHA